MQTEFVRPARTIVPTRLRVLQERDFYRYIGASVAVGMLVSMLLAGVVLLLSGMGTATGTNAAIAPTHAFEAAAVAMEAWNDPACGVFEPLEPAESLYEAGYAPPRRTL